MNTGSALCFALAAVACGQSVREPPSATGGQGGVGGQGGAAACVGPFWMWMAPPPGAGKRVAHKAAPWKTDKVVVWGGRDGPATVLGTGWKIGADGLVESIPGSPGILPRAGHALGVWGDELLIWGGWAGGADPIAEGVRLDLTSGDLHPVAKGGQLSPRDGVNYGFAGGRWLLWGGSDGVQKLESGAAYDLADSWASIADAPVPYELGSWAVAQTDLGPALFGGLDLGISKAMEYTNFGYLRKADGSWLQFPTDGAPSPRAGAVMVWSRTTNELIVWGGYGDDISNPPGDGSRLSFDDWQWRPMNKAGAPDSHFDYQAVVLETGTIGPKVVLLGSSAASLAGSPGGIYDIMSDTWEPLPMDECAPPVEAEDIQVFVAFGNGYQALLWGSYTSDKQAQPEQGWVLTLKP